MWCFHRVVLTQSQLEKKSHFILSDRSGFDMINNLSIAVHAFARRMLTSLSADEILLPRYENLSTYFISLSLRVDIVHSHLKYKYFVLFAFTWRLRLGWVYLSASVIFLAGYPSVSIPFARMVKF